MNFVPPVLVEFCDLIERILTRTAAETINSSALDGPDDAGLGATAEKDQR